MARRAANGVVYSGPFFEADPAKRIGQNIDALTRHMAAEAAQMMRSQFTPGHGSELAGTIVERYPARIGRTYLGLVKSTMSGPNPANPNPNSWVTWAERGRRRVKGQSVSSPTFKGFHMWARVGRTVRGRFKEERIRLGVIKGVA